MSEALAPELLEEVRRFVLGEAAATGEVVRLDGAVSVSVAKHLNIDVAEYDARIRTFIPHYEELIGTAASALQVLDAVAPTIVDLGIGTGALAARCLDTMPGARLIGIDADPAMLEVARVRLDRRAHVRFVESDFLEADLPPCDALVASLALHHVATPDAKKTFYARCSEALEPGGVLLSADCFPARDPRVASGQRQAWLEHLMQTYSLEAAEGYFAAWAGEDAYFPLADELDWLREAGLRPDVIWRKGSFAVVGAIRPAR